MDEYEQKRADAEQLAAMEAQVDPTLAEPAPADLELDRALVDRKIQAELLAGPPEVREDWAAGRLQWALGGFDAKGWGWISVFRSADGAELGAWRVHWSALVAR
jgi:hypothetical protein